MTLFVVVDTIVARLEGALGSGTRVADSLPRAVADLPSVTVALDEVTSEVAGIGRIPRGTRRGALPVTEEVDLADPVLDLGGGETLTLVSADRRTLILPNGPLVRADGTADQPFGAEDLVVDDGAPWTVVASTPTGRQVRPDPEAGTLAFGTALPDAGTLRVELHLGLWDTTASRYRGRLLLTAVAVAGEGSDLAREVARSLAQDQAGLRLAPRSWGAAGPGQPGEVPADAQDSGARAQLLTYTFDAEIEEPSLSSGGGVITTVQVRSVTSDTDGSAENFDIVRSA